MKEAAALLGLSSGRRLLALLRDRKIVTKRDSSNIVNQKYVRLGYFRNVIKSHYRGYGEHQYIQPMVTESGISFISSELMSESEQAAETVRGGDIETEKRSAETGSAGKGTAPSA